jgi:NAD(P)-dependent dehydrogenase (short-subunit alcohol dehydrogenase family)
VPIYPELVGKVAVVTGGGHNLGRAIALGFARAGVTVAVVDLDGDAAARTEPRRVCRRHGSLSQAASGISSCAA